MSTYKDVSYVGHGYSYIIREDGDFDILHNGKRIVTVESEDAVYEVVGVCKGD